MPDELLHALHRLVELVLLEVCGDFGEGPGEPSEDPEVGGPEGRGPGGGLGQFSEVPGDELSQVVDLDADLLPADDVLLPEGMVDAEGAVGRVVAEGIGAVLLQDGDGVDDVPGGGVHRGPVGGHDEPVDHDVLPGDGVLDLLRPEYGVERPGPDDVVALGPEGHGEELLVELGVPLPESVVER